MKTIDKVTTTNLDLALRMAGIYINPKDIDKIIDIVDLIEEKGDDTSIRDISKLQAEWDWDKEADTIINENKNTENIKLKDLVQNEWYHLEDDTFNNYHLIFKFCSLDKMNGENDRINYYLMLDLNTPREDFFSNYFISYNASFDIIRKAPKELVLNCFPNEFDAK